MTCVQAYTDGSYSPIQGYGAWVSVLFIDEEKFVLEGEEENTSQHRMELIAVIKTIEFLKSTHPLPSRITFFTDSQFVVDLPSRIQRFQANGFKTKKGNEIKHLDLIQRFYRVNKEVVIILERVKGHSKKSEGQTWTKFVDRRSRAKVRAFVSGKKKNDSSF